MQTAHIVVLTTFPNIDTAQQFADEIVLAKLAACVNTIPGAQSTYMWKGEICRDSECIALMKTTQHCYAELEAYIKRHHPYELPEIIATPISNGSKEYLSWLRNGLKADTET